MRAPGTKAAPSRARRVLRRAGLVLLVAVFGAVLAGGWAYHGARAQVSESLWDLGSQMMRYAESRNQDAPRDLVLNGQVIRLSSGTADRSTREVLDFFEARCAEVDGNLGEELAALRRDHPEAFPASASATPVLREDDGRQGYVACMELDPEMTTAELTRRLARFGETGDVADIGEMRFVFVEGSGERTHFVAMWTNGSFNLNRMFPEEGDAPGQDADGIPRPPRSRRVLSSWERGEPYSISVYETRDDEADLERFYRRELARGGWTVLATDARAAGDAPRTLVAERGERMVTVVMTTDLATQRASAAVIDAR